MSKCMTRGALAMLALVVFYSPTVFGQPAAAAPAAPGAAPATQPAQPAPAASALEQQMIDAYKNTQSYQATAVFGIEQVEGRVTTTKTAPIFTAFERPAGKVLIDRPDCAITSDGAKLRVRFDKLSDRHLEMAATEATLAAMAKSVPFVVSPHLPDMAMLMGGWAVEGQRVAAEELKPDSVGRPGLRYKTADGVVTLRLDPATHLVAVSTLEYAVLPEPGGPLPDPNERVIATYLITVEKHNQPVDAKVFAPEMGKSKAYATLEGLSEAMREEMTKQMAQGGHAEIGAPAAGDHADDDGHDHAPGGHPLEGKPAPPIAVKTADGADFKLADQKAAIVVLDFWATWCGPCRVSLPQLQKVSDWVGKQQLNVAVYTVNIREEAGAAKEFFAKNKLTLPILLDGDGKVSDAYGVAAIPMLVMIHQGKIAHVHIGSSPTLEADLQAQITKLLGDMAPKEAMPPGHP